MEQKFDAEKARRVWQRVQGHMQPPAIDFSQLISAKAQTAAMYQRLARYYKGNIGGMFQKFYWQEQNHIGTLTDFCRRFTGQSPAVYTPLPRKEPVFSILQQCYSQKLQLMDTYQKHASGPYGSIFQDIIDDEQTQCRYLLQLMKK